MEKGIANRSLDALLTNIRQEVAELGLSPERLPGWISAAKIRTGWVNDCVVAVFEDALDASSFRTVGLVHADTVVLLDGPDFVPRSFSFDLSPKSGLAAARRTGLVLLQGELTHSGTATLALSGKPGAFFNVGFCGYFSPCGLLNVFLQVVPESAKHPSAVHFVPFALSIHEDDIADVPGLIRRCVGIVLGSLQRIHDSAAGDYYAAHHRRFETFGINHDKGIIVLGSYADEEIRELLQIRDELRRRGYDAHLIEDLPETPLMSLPDKVRHWTGGSRFAVMVDRKPSGHLNEYEILKQQGAILARLHQRRSGSTRMIGAEDINYNFIRDFGFDESPLEAIEDAVIWADAFAEERISRYVQLYPWKRPKETN